MSNSVSNQMKDILDEVMKEIDVVTEEALSETAQETVVKIKEKSPKSTSKGKHYRAGWKKRRDIDKSTGKRVYTVYNKNKPTLTHLLERGHAKVGGGRVAAIPHIQPAAEWAADELVKKVEDKL